MAIKSFDFTLESYIKREATTLQMANHQNVVQFLGLEEVVDRINKKVLVMEYCSGGNLQDLINSKGSGMTSDDFLSIFRDLTSGIKHLREKELIHRDIKPANILITTREDGKTVYKLADFGAARLLKSNQCYSSLYGTYEYIHPEIFGKFFAKALDDIRPQQVFTDSHELWSIGVTLYEIATGHLPFDPMNGRAEPKVMFKMTNEKPTGDISATELEDSRIEWSNKLPNCQIALENIHLKQTLEVFFAALLEVSLLLKKQILFVVSKIH